MELKVQHNCPINNFEPCKQLECAWFTKLVGKNPQGEKEIEEWGCAVTMLPLILIDQNVGIRGTQSAVESFRNKMIEQQDELLQLAKENDIETKLIE